MSPGSCQVKPCNCLLVGPRRERHLEMILGTTFVRGEEWTAGQREPLNRCDSVTSQPNPQGALPRGDTSELLESRQGLGLHSCLKQTLDVGFPRGRWELAQSPSLSSSVLMEGQRGTPPCPLHVLWATTSTPPVLILPTLPAFNTADQFLLEKSFFLNSQNGTLLWGFFLTCLTISAQALSGSSLSSLGHSILLVLLLKCSCTVLSFKKTLHPWDCAGGPVARTPCSQCRGPIPGQGMRSHMLQLRVHVPQLRPGASKLPKKKKKKKRNSTDSDDLIDIVIQLNLTCIELSIQTSRI